MQEEYLQNKIDKEYYKSRMDELPMMQDYLTEFAADEKGDDIFNVIDTKLKNSLTIYPYHLRAYILLKMENPKLALLYLEDLLSSGIAGCHITNDLIVRALIENTEPVLSEQFMKRFKNRSVKDKLKKIIFRNKDSFKFI